MSAAIRLVLGDQLSHSLSSLANLNDKSDVVLMAEVQSEATYVRHHPKKIALIFSAMRHFADELAVKGVKVNYVAIDDPDNGGSLFSEVNRLWATGQFERVVVTQPGEFRLWQEIGQWQERLGGPVTVLDDTRFMASLNDFQDWAAGKKQWRMEYFYRQLRKSTGILMGDDGKPEGGKWNYDSDNRKPLSKGAPTRKPLTFEPDKTTQAVLKTVDRLFSHHFGHLYPFHFAVNRQQALQVLNHFIEQRLPYFGDYQDAMDHDDPWLFHSHISFYLNCGLLLPMDALRAAEAAYEQGKAPLNAVEGFIRQILGWREYVRGLYWATMPHYAALNYLEADRKLPDFFWTGETRMQCLKQCIKTTQENAYAHHIQRLMVLGNFLLLAGIDPEAVNEWYLLVYADAYEWVEMPNVTGMILFADQGLMASKPYACSGSYINKMSNYCEHCVYRVNQKNGKEACPFNYLYWDFLRRNQDKLNKNARLAMPYRTLSNMKSEKIDLIQSDAENFFQRLDANECV